MEMEMEMEMRASSEIEIGIDITPLLIPLACSLYDKFLSSHCSSCFSPLPSNNPTSPFSYCSSQCSLSFSPSQLHLLHHPITSFPDSSDLRLSLHLLQTLPFISSTRIHNLLTNHEKLMKDDEMSTTIREGARAISRASNKGEIMDGVLLEEEAVLCLVLTNAVEVNIDGRGLGIAVYDVDFSWINHSCSPNACYRFMTRVDLCCESSSLSIVPACRGDKNEVYDGDCDESEIGKGVGEYGPRIVVRSIRDIKKGEEVTVAYIGLLQPKEMRQQELWCKYKFICCCNRCRAQPPTYVDQVLQEIFVANDDLTNPSMDEAFEKMKNYIDDAITEYLSDGNPESCCEKLETLLAQGFHDEQLDVNEGKSNINLRLHPLHSLSLNAYTTLASAYKARTYQTTGPLLGILGSFSMSKANAAYSLLLACMTHYLFLSESSLIVSATNFWTSAGESLIFLARSSAWNLVLETDSTISDHLLLPIHRCENCFLMSKFESNFCKCEAQTAEFDNISGKFFNCLTAIMPQIWNFLIQDRQYLRKFTDPVVLGWFDNNKRASDVLDFDVPSGGTGVTFRVCIKENISCGEVQRFTHKERISLFHLGLHCILYGGYLSTICYGQDNHLTCNIQDNLYGN